MNTDALNNDALLPQRPGGHAPGAVMAVLVHLGLIAALTLGVDWRVREKQGGDASVPVVISADKSVRYENVVRVMDTLQRAGVRRVGLSVKQGAS